ncbi:MAG: pilus assembly protein [Caulobacteraceae bacterium]|nr:pilus assembly protein [Caulobacteraceae bacterium]
MNRIRAKIRRLAARIGITDRRGVAAVEFALIAPLFAMLLAAMIDFGGVLYTKFQLDSAVSAGANYALVNAASVNSVNGATLASTVARVVATSQGAAWANGGIVVNNGPTSTVTSGTAVASGTASNADSCYCPTTSGSTFSWGSAATCSSSCPSGGLAGKFVRISASRAYTPMFSSYGIVSSHTITATALVQVQ